MQFNSYSYLLLLIPFVMGFWMIPTASARKWYLLGASALFYASWSMQFVALPFLICGISYFFAHRILVRKNQPGSDLKTGISVILIILAFFKYRDFFLDNLNHLLTSAGQNPVTFAWHIILPLGISFYSFEAISYLIDVKQGRVKDVDYPNLSLFVTFFPHLIAGPIVRVRELVPQFQQLKKFEKRFLVEGLDRLIWGLVQKNVFANSLSLFVDEGFAASAIANNSSLDNWTLTAAFGMQIYFDFASYSNMAIGTAKLMGINLPENFRYPYHASNPSDFWQRWHMTLSRWIRDYLFFPINAKYSGAPIPLYISLVVIMSLVGLWHGAGWGFILWGAMHGLLLVGYRIWEKAAETRPILKTSFWALSLVRVLTLAGVFAAWVPFRAATIDQSLTMLKSMLFQFKIQPNYSLNLYLITAALAGFCLIEPWLAEHITKLEKSIASRDWKFPVMDLVRPAIYATLIFLFLLFDDQDVQFIYFQF